MKAFDVLMVVNRCEMRQGKDYLDAPKNNNVSLEIKEGKLSRNHWYFCTFNESPSLGDPACVLVLGGGDTQYLYGVEK